MDHVLTSAEAIAMLEEKEKQKKEEQAAKELQKKECEEKKQQREQEKIQEAEERLKSEAERKQKAEERELEKIQNKGKRKAELQQKQAAEREKHTRYGKQQISAAHDGLQSAEISSNECVACLGAFEGNIVDSVLEKELDSVHQLGSLHVGKGCIAAASLLMKMDSISAISAKSYFPEFC